MPKNILLTGAKFQYYAKGAPARHKALHKGWDIGASIFLSLSRIIYSEGQLAITKCFVTVRLNA